MTSSWLSDRLRELELDHDVYHGYLMSFLTSDESQESILSSISELLGSLVDQKTADSLSRELVDRWQDESRGSQRSAKTVVQEEKGKKTEEAFLQAIAMTKTIPSSDEKTPEPKKELTKEEKEMRARVLAQYGQVVDGPDEEEEERRKVEESAKAAAADVSKRKQGKPSAAAGAGLSGTPLVEIKNAKGVEEEAAKMRAANKAQHEAKVQRDRASQEKQKLTKEEKKAKRQAACQKGERRR